MLTFAISDFLVNVLPLLFYVAILAYIVSVIERLLKRK